ncbi:hypothetical protein Pmani_035402 [Petrolisthes manimaculis]|uniref:Uncharacterized protein n=1 Tax=Petrolisthes manimaculis TaxID=1843537 RepID=A0AAE1NLR3_9EUCA|nr:hypothetical protein Pmani_035402 [Petrolisthes manimaculis]
MKGEIEREGRKENRRGGGGKDKKWEGKKEGRGTECEGRKMEGEKLLVDMGGDERRDEMEAGKDPLGTAGEGVLSGTEEAGIAGRGGGSRPAGKATVRVRVRGRGRGRADPLLSQIKRRLDCGGPGSNGNGVLARQGGGGGGGGGKEQGEAKKDTRW